MNIQELVKLYETTKDTEYVRLMAAKSGIPFSQVSLHYGMKSALTGWKLGYRDGMLEVDGKMPPPGAIRLGWRKLIHGSGYVLGRQHALATAGLHGGTAGRSTLESMADFLKELRIEETK